MPRAPCHSWSLEPSRAPSTALPLLGAHGSQGRGSRTGTPTRCWIRSPRPSTAPLPPCGICSLSGGSETWESSLMAGKHKENSSTNKGEGRELRALPIKNTDHKRRRARQGGEQGSCVATLLAGTEHVPGCPPCRDCRRGDGEQRAPMSTVPSCPARTDADAGAIGQTLPHRGTVAPPALGPLLRQPELHHCPWDTPMSPQAAQVMVVPRGSTGLPLHPSPKAQPPQRLSEQLAPREHPEGPDGTEQGRAGHRPPQERGTCCAAGSSEPRHRWVRLQPAIPAHTGSRSRLP